MLSYLIKLLFMLSFVKTVKTIPCSFNGMTWLLSLLTCKAFAVQSEIMSSRSNKYQSNSLWRSVSLRMDEYNFNNKFLFMFVFMCALFRFGVIQLYTDI